MSMRYPSTFVIFVQPLFCRLPVASAVCMASDDEEELPNVGQEEGDESAAQQGGSLGDVSPGLCSSGCACGLPQA